MKRESHANIPFDCSNGCHYGPKPVEMTPLTLSLSISLRERSGSVVECLTQDRGATDSSLTGGSALCL